MKTLAIILSILFGVLLFGGIAYSWSHIRLINIIALIADGFFTVDRFIAILGLVLSVLSFIATIVLTIIGLYIANKSLYVANVALEETRKSGPITESILTQSRDALKSSVDILKQQQDILDKSKKALDTSNETAERQQAILEQSLVAFTAQLDIAVKERAARTIADRNRLKNTIAKIQNTFPMTPETFSRFSRPSRVAWLADVLNLFEFETYNSVLLQDEKANHYWQSSIERMRFQLSTNNDSFLAMSVVTMGPNPNAPGKAIMGQGANGIEENYQILFHRCAVEVMRDTYYILYAVVEKDQDKADASYRGFDAIASEINL